MILEGILLIFITLLVLFLGVLMIFKNKKSLINIWYSLIMLSGSLWIFGLFIFIYINDLNIILFWSRLFYFAVTIMVYAFLNFAIYFPFKDINYNIKYKILTIIPFFIITYLIFFTKFLIIGIEIVNLKKNIILGPANYFFILYLLIYVLFAIIIWFFKYRSSTKIDKVKLNYILIIMTFSLLVGFFVNLFLPVFTFKYIWILPISIIIMSILIFYTLAKFKLLNIRLIIIRTILEGILVIFIASFFTLSILFTGYFFQDYAEVIKVFVYFIDALIIIIFLDPLKKIWRKSTNFIFYKIKIKIDYEKILKDFNLIIAKEIELRSLLNKLVNFLKGKLKIKKVTVIVLNNKDNIIASSNNKIVRFNLNNKIINYFKFHDDIIITDELIKKSKELKGNFRLHYVLKELKKSNIELLIPIINNDNLIAIILLSKKLSKDIYNDEDIDLFKELKFHITVAIDKSNLFEKIKLLNKELQYKVKEKTKDLEDLNNTLEERNNFLITIQSIISTISKTFNLREATQMIADSISSKLGYIGGILSFVNYDKNILHIGTFTENEETISAFKIFKKEFKNFDAELNKDYNLGTKTILKNEITFSNKMSDYFSTPVNKRIINNMQKILKIETIVGIPIFSKDKSIGLIHFLFKQKKKDISPLDMETMTTLADQVGIISRNLTLYENLQKTNKKLQDANVNLRRLDKTKSEFLSIASHQLRTPISALKGYLSMILEGDFGETPIKIKKILFKLLDSSSRLSRTINIFLNVSRIESGRFSLDKKPTKIEELIISVIKELENESKKKGIVLKYKKICKKKVILSLIDKDKIREVILNLIDNAIKYTNKGHVHISLDCDKENLKFVVKDTGLGINKVDLSMLFKKFVRGTGASNVYTSGSGLGLFIAQKVIKEHDGDIWAESNGKNKGSIFSFSLPIFKK